ncbi:protein DEHYDRATION-INDUCED 19 homolog 2-like isoform X2 [Curcuma longa]|uniref:protein DEHYDRATION-INDUCED 19 homolog 2-like isoform X2 n=1 Tax=Curcuma longa TaxID=136217 RepID=UPI003D9FA7F1
MEYDAWSRLSAAASKRHQAALQSRYVDASRDPNFRSWRDLFLGFEELDGGEDDLRAEYPCPFCFEDFDIVGLCCHIDEEHPAEGRNVCPICAARAGVDLVGHLMTQHGNIFKMQRRRKYHKGSSASHTMLSLLRKDLRDGNLHALLGGSSHMVPPPAAPDPFISSLFYTLPLDESSKDAQAESLSEGILTGNNSDEKLVERVEPSLTDKDQKERARRSMFVQELVLSTIFDSTL